MKEKEIFAFLAKYDTPTICNALELAVGKRMNSGFTVGTLVCVDANLSAFVGYAITAKIQGRQPSPLTNKAVKKLRLDYYRYIANAAENSVLVIEDKDTIPISAFWGEINVAIHKNLGIKGVLTNGVLRDLGTLDPCFQVLAGSLGPSHAHVWVSKIDCEVEVFGLRVSPRDIIHADRHGAVIIEKKYLSKMPQCVLSVMEKEAPILKTARKKGFDFKKLEQAWEDFTNYKPDFKHNLDL